MSIGHLLQCPCVPEGLSHKPEYQRGCSTGQGAHELGGGGERPREQRMEEFKTVFILRAAGPQNPSSEKRYQRVEAGEQGCRPKNGIPGAYPD